MHLPWLLPRHCVIDRYVLWLFLKVLVISFFSLLGLYVVIDLMNNFQEFSSYGENAAGGLAGVLWDYYSPRVYWFFDLTAGLTAMIAGIFAVTWMQRTNELTALMAAGIKPTRVIRFVWLAAIGVALAGIVNREVLLPAVREKLSRNAQDWLGSAAKPCRPMWDLKTNILISGKDTFANQKRIEAPTFSQLPEEFKSWGRQITADNAWYQPPVDGRPSGYLVRGVRLPENLNSLDSAAIAGDTTLFSPKDNRWLKPGECFVASGVSFEQLTVGNQWQEYMSTAELIAGLYNQSLDYGSYVRVTLHKRFVQPLLDVTLIFLGLPLVLARGQRNLFAAGGYAAALVLAFFCVTLSSHSAGQNYLLSPHLAAWLPLIVFAPIAYVLARPLWD
ncbi:MAG TPA: LptF/LptG family permease [Pirellulaceae bacterium]|nr:LptF/LptG family permease [Pirellulaceae bacterium]